VRKKNSRREDGPDEVYRGFESPLRSVEGYRILWIWSSQKLEQDRAVRQRSIQRAIEELEDGHWCARTKHALFTARISQLSNESRRRGPRGRSADGAGHSARLGGGSPGADASPRARSRDRAAPLLELHTARPHLNRWRNRTVPGRATLMNREIPPLTPKWNHATSTRSTRMAVPTSTPKRRAKALGRLSRRALRPVEARSE
jgi:hypothetical protein